MSASFINIGLNLSASALYLGAGGLILQRLFQPGAHPAGQKAIVLTFAVAAAVLHATLLYLSHASSGEWNLGFTSAISIVAWSAAVIFIVTSFTKAAVELGVLVMPMAAIAVIAAWVWPGGEQGFKTPSLLLNAHITVSLLAYAFFTLASVQAILLAIQEKYLHQRSPGRLLRALPPIQTMETFLFQLIGLGFGLLTLTLASGTIFSRELFGAPFVFNHHTVLSIVSWVIFGILLLGHWRLGWRGRSAVRWTLGGFAFLALAYFGTKFVLEFVL